MSYHGMVVRRRVAPGHEMLELTLDVGQERRCAEPEQICPQPAGAELFLHQDEPVEGLFGLADPTRRLEPDGVSGALVVVADLPRHDHPDGEGRVHRLFAGGRLDEVGAGHHGDRKSTRLNSSHGYISYAVFCLKKKKTNHVRHLSSNSRRASMNQSSEKSVTSFSHTTSTTTMVSHTCITTRRSPTAKLMTFITY